MSEKAVVLKQGEFIAVEGDSEKYIPPTYVGHPIAPNHFCRAWARSGKYCPQVAGAGTDHKGVGRCKHHGGATPVKHGLRSMYLVRSERMAERIRRMEDDPTLADMRNELVILCALLDETLSRPKPDRAAVERLSIEVSRMKERVHNVSAKKFFSIEQMRNYWMNLNRIIESVLKDEPDLCVKLQQQLQQISP